MTEITIYTDGAARGNPGPSASGFLIYLNGRETKKHAEYNGKMTNNSAEYIAVIKALEWSLDNIKDCGKKTLELYSDSELVIRQINKLYKVKSGKMKELNERVINIQKGFKSTKFMNLPREDPHIRRVDAHLNELLDEVKETDTKD
jgi:ribonuclease HI